MSCDIEEYIDYKNCKCRRNIVCELVEECSENIDENELIYNETLNAIPLKNYNKVSASFRLYIAFLAVFLATSTVVSTIFFSLVFKKEYYQCLLLI